MLFLHDSLSMTQEGQAKQDVCFLSVLFRLVLACYNPFRNRELPNKKTTQNEDGGDKTELTYILDTEPSKVIKSLLQVQFLIT